MQEKLFLLIFLFQQSQAVYASKAHTHDVVKINMAGESSSGNIEILFPADLVFGFEHKPRNETESAKVKTVLNDLQAKSPEQFIGMESKLNCQWQKPKVEWKPTSSEKHSDLAWSTDIKCQKNPLGTRLILNLGQHYPSLHKVQIQVLWDAFQKSWSLKGDQTEFELK